MAELKIDASREAFEPGEVVEFSGSWQLDQVPQSIELRLLWYTSGRGGEDVSEEATCEIPPSQTGTHVWRLALPNEPYSFCGRLFSVNWVVELLVDGGELAAERAIVIGPGHKAIGQDARS